tara:strand:+ start:1346 stop:2044 length:699 start_codon:yes stop_codon:yes gene_type:complete
MESSVIKPLDGDLDLKLRILEIAYKNKLSHLGSYFSSVDIIDNVYQEMGASDTEDIFILSSGHCAVALYCVLEKYKTTSADHLFKMQGGHPHFNKEFEIHCSTGSLGMGLTVAVGRALADPSKHVHCLISDGECAEGSIWESLSFIHNNNIKNITVHVNVNGYCAYDSVDTRYLVRRLQSFLPDIKVYFTSVGHFSFLRGINAHYHIMKKQEYEEARAILITKRRELNEKAV